MNPARIARELSDLAKHAASAAKGMHARGDANGGYYNDGREAAFGWLAHQLLNDDSHLMRKLREEMGREQPTATERIDAAKVASLRATWWDADSMVRTDNALTKGGYLRVVDVIDVHDRELMKVHNFGRHCLRDVRAIIEAIGPVTSAEIAAAKAAP